MFFNSNKFNNQKNLLVRVYYVYIIQLINKYKHECTFVIIQLNKYKYQCNVNTNINMK